MTILVIAPHPDDETLGCGGSLLLHAAAGDQTAAVWLTRGELGLKHLPAPKARQTREREARRAAKMLKLNESTFLDHPDWGVAECIDAVRRNLIPVLNRLQPDIVYLPHPLDHHPDHQPVLNILQSALTSCPNLKPELRGYEVWSPVPRVDYTQDISRVMTRKLDALRCHRSQMKDFDYVRAVRGLNQFRGALAGKCRYAEVFQDLSEHSPTP